MGKHHAAPGYQGAGQQNPATIQHYPRKYEVMESMSPEKVAGEVCALVAQVRGLKPSEVTPDATFKSLGVSSLDALSLAFEIEERFKISVPDDQLARFRTVQAVIDGVVAALAKAEP